MARLLYRLGRISAQYPLRVVVAWALIFMLSGVAFLIGNKPLSDSFDIPGTASGQVVAELSEKIPEFSGASGLIVLQTEDGSPFTESQREELSKLANGIAELPAVAGVVDPFATEVMRQAQFSELTTLSEQLEQQMAQLEAAPGDQSAAIAELTGAMQSIAGAFELAGYAAEIQTISADQTTAVMNVTFHDSRLELSPADKNHLIEYVSGQNVPGVTVAFSVEIAQMVPELLGVGEIVGLLVAALVLIVMFGNARAVSFPIITAITGVGIGVLIALGLSGVVEMTSVSPVLGLMLGLAVGIDYSLFIINRHRRHLLSGMSVADSIPLANGTAGNAVVFAGATVVVALLAFNVCGVPFLGVMGSVAALCVTIAVMLAVTMVPACLSLAGKKVLRRKELTRLADAGEPKLQTELPITSKFRSVTTAITVGLGLLVIALPALSMRVNLPDGSLEPVGSDSYRAHHIVAEKFGAGANGPLLVTAAIDSGDEAEVFAQQLAIARTLIAVPDVVAVAPVAAASDNSLLVFQVLPTSGPQSESTAQLVDTLRELPAVNGDKKFGVAGQAAINLDISDNLIGVLPLYLGLVIGISLLIMTAVFRSILVPVIATGGFVLSLFATYGATVAVFQWGWLAQIFNVTTTGPILNFLPIILVGVLFGLAMDYQLFLASGMREAYVQGLSARSAVTKGFQAGKAVVIAAGLIMVAVFGGFIFTDSNMIRSIGFGLAVGVLIDAFLVRLLLMPALMNLLGDTAWWLPRWLDRILPQVDVEGSSLTKTDSTPAVS